MPVKFTVKTFYTINGKRYESLEEMPPEIREIYEKAAAEIAKNGREVIGAVENALEGKTPDTEAVCDERGAPNDYASPRLKAAYSKIWAFVLSGAASLALVLLFGGKIEGAEKFQADSNAGWLLAVPALFFAAAVYSSVKNWRCESCRSFLPTINYPKEDPRCEKCGRRHILR